MQNLRKIGVALAVPVIAVAAITFTAHSALSAPTAAPAAAATDQPNQQYQTNVPKQLNTNGRLYTAYTRFTLYTNFTQKSPATSAATTAPSTTTKSPTTTPTKTPTATPSGSASGSAVPSGSASGGAGAGGGGGVAGAAPTNCASKQVQPPLTVKVATVRNAQALVDGDGCTLYLFTKDTATASGCDATCEAVWPPAPGPAAAVPDLQQQNFTTFARTTGFVQTAYFGKQLYYYVGDKAPGDANGQGLNAAWYIVDPSGNPIMQ